MVDQNELMHIPVVVEIVAVPSSFDIELYLTMRESAGMFDGHETALNHVKFIAESIKGSPYFVLSQCPDKTIQSALFVLYIFNKAGLTIDSNYNHANDSKFRGRELDFATKWEFFSDKGTSQHAFVVIVVNLYALIELGVVDQIQKQVKDTLERTGHLHVTMDKIKEH